MVFTPMLAGLSLLLVILVTIFCTDLLVVLYYYTWHLAEPNVNPDVNEEEQAPEAGDEQAPEAGDEQASNGHELQVLDGEGLQVRGGERRRRPDISRRSRTFVILRFAQYNAVPVLAAVVAALFAAAGFGTAYGEGASVVLPPSPALEMTCRSQLMAKVDPDIIGPGIFILIGLQISLSVGFAVHGHFGGEGSLCSKEVGAGLNLTHFALAIALALQMARGNLSSADLILGAMVLDSQNSAMSIQLVTKEVLAARSQVRATIASQVIGFTVLGICVAKFVAGEFVSDNDNSCHCIKIFWWGWVSDCPDTMEAGGATIFWVYLACRIVASGHAAFFAATRTSDFHRAEHRRFYILEDAVFWVPTSLQANRASQTPSAQRPDGRVWLRMRDYHFSFLRCPATVTLQYTINAAFSVISLAAITQTLGRGMSAGSSSVGQTIAMVVGVNTMGRVGWVALRSTLDQINRLAQPSVTRVSTFFSSPRRDQRSNDQFP